MRKIIVVALILNVIANGCKKEFAEPEATSITDGVLIGTWNAVVNGQMWNFRIGYQSEGNISGAKVVDTVVIPFTGNYDTLTRDITIHEYNLNDSLCGEFRGRISEDIQSMEGVWTRYHDGSSVSIGIGRVDTNYNRIILSNSGNVYLYLVSSEAFYHGSLGMIQPDSTELCDDYKNYIGDTLNLGYHSAGTEFIFYISVFNTGITYFSNNYDHAIIVQESPNMWQIKWEDSENIDRDFDDLIIEVFVRR